MRILIRRLHYLTAQTQRVESEALGYEILAAMARRGTPWNALIPFPLRNGPAEPLQKCSSDSAGEKHLR